MDISVGSIAHTHPNSRIRRLHLGLDLHPPNPLRRVIFQLVVGAERARECLAYIRVSEFGGEGEQRGEGEWVAWC